MEAASDVTIGWLSLAPALLAITVAVLMRSVIPALLSGIWLGAWLSSGLTLRSLLTSFFDVFDHYIVTALAASDHVTIIVFCCLIGALTGVISRNGGTRGISDWAAQRLSNRRQGQVAASGLGLFIFFDDLASSLIVGNTMQPIADRLKLSREKLAFILDSTAAPVAAVSLASTWVGFEIATVDNALTASGNSSFTAYDVFLNSLAYSFYPTFIILFVILMAITGRDFGPMLRAESSAQQNNHSEQESASSGQSSAKARNAIIPLLMLLIGVGCCLFLTGEGEGLFSRVSSGNPYSALMAGSVLGLVAAIGLSMSHAAMSLEEVVQAGVEGMQPILGALIILVLAWALGDIISELGASQFLSGMITDATPIKFLPALLFFVAAITSFSTGTSWGTMGILMPIAIPLGLSGYEILGQEYPYLLYASVGAVLSGAVWGDHSSPISDTTIISSMAANCPHIDHVRTQLPYTILIGLIALALGFIPAGFGVPLLMLLIIAIVCIFLFLWLLGRDPEAIEQH